MYGTGENPDRRRKANNAATSNSRNTLSTGIVNSMNKNEGHRLSGGRLDNVLNELRPNRTRITTVFKPPTHSKSNELLSLFDTKNTSKQMNGHQLNVVSNDLGNLFNPPDSMEGTHTAHQPTDQELFGTNDIDKSRCLVCL